MFLDHIIHSVGLCNCCNNCHFVFSESDTCPICKTPIKRPLFTDKELILEELKTDYWFLKYEDLDITEIKRPIDNWLEELGGYTHTMLLEPNSLIELNSSELDKVLHGIYLDTSIRLFEKDIKEWLENPKPLMIFHSPDDPILIGVCSEPAIWISIAKGYGLEEIPTLEVSFKTFREKLREGLISESNFEEELIRHEDISAKLSSRHYDFNIQTTLGLEYEDFLK